MEAVGAYLRTLREAQHLSRAAVAAQIETHESQLVRIEAGDQDSRGSLLLALVAAVQGRVADVQRLILDKSATESDGRAAAEAWLALTPEERARVDSIVANALPGDLAGAIAELRAEYHDDHGLAALLRGFLLGWRARSSGPPRQ